MTEEVNGKASDIAPQSGEMQMITDGQRLYFQFNVPVTKIGFTPAQVAGLIATMATALVEIGVRKPVILTAGADELPAGRG